MKPGKWSILLFLIAAIAGCERSGTLKIADITKPESFVVRARSNSPTGITINVKGQINGTAYVYIHDYSKVDLNGAVDRGVYHDWLEQDCTIHFEPGTASSGSLELSYSFD